MKHLILLIIPIVSSLFVRADISDSIRNTSVKLFPLIDLESNGHFVTSPFSIFSLMTSVKSVASGESRKQINKAFHLPKNAKDDYRELEKVLTQQSDGVTFFTQNFMFIDETLQLNKKYDNKLEKPSSEKPRTIVKKLDFTSDQAVVQANNIIEKSGANISDLLSSNNFENSRMILTNVITFKGLWSLPFNESDTTIEPFYDENGNEIGKVNMMYQRYQYRFSYVESLNALVLELPYGSDGKYCMLVVLPRPNISLRDVYQNFEKVSYVDIFKKLQNEEDEFGLTDVDVRLPRFKISTKIVLNNPLHSMGVYDIFEPGRANFEKITKEQLYISEIIHKADIEITESGTVASAVTDAYFTDRISTPEFKACRPFIYLILEKNSSTVIFTGIYSEPSLF